MKSQQKPNSIYIWAKKDYNILTLDMVKNVETENGIKIYIYNNNNVDIDKYLQWHQKEKKRQAVNLT